MQSPSEAAFKLHPYNGGMRHTVVFQDQSRQSPNELRRKSFDRSSSKLPLTYGEGTEEA